MKNVLTLAFMLIIGVSAFGADAGLELRGILVGVDATKFSLVDKSNDTTRWVAVGQSFAGYKVTAYDPTTETVTVTKDGNSTRLRMSTTKLKEAPPMALMPTAPVEITRAIQNNLRQISAAADQYFLENGKNSVALSELVGPTKYIKQLNPVDGESYAGMQLKMGTPISVTTARGVNVSFAP